MMAHDVEYNDHQARSGAQQFDQLGSDLSSLASRMSSELAGDSPWSHDEIGASFASKFDPDRSTVIDNLKGFAETVESIGPALKKAIDAITSADGEGAR
jgi:hypothetical protein